MALDPAVLFNLSTLQIHVPPSPLGPGPPPSSLKRQPGNGPTQQHNQAIDEWVTRISQSQEREEAYYGRLLGGRPSAISLQAAGLITRNHSGG